MLKSSIFFLTTCLALAATISAINPEVVVYFTLPPTTHNLDAVDSATSSSSGLGGVEEEPKNDQTAKLGNVQCMLQANNGYQQIAAACDSLGLEQAYAQCNDDDKGILQEHYFIATGDHD
jgi:hypothetical protein